MLAWCLWHEFSFNMHVMGGQRWGPCIALLLGSQSAGCLAALVSCGIRCQGTVCVVFTVGMVQAWQPVHVMQSSLPEQASHHE